MTSTTCTDTLARPDQDLTVITEWARSYPTARFVVVALAPDGLNAELLGWGLALPDHVFVHLPALAISGQFDNVDDCVRLLNITTDARLVWVDPEPEHWPEESD
jgi:hypothetical protein